MRFRHKKYRNALLHTPYGKLDFKDGEAESDNPEMVKAMSRHPDMKALDQGQQELKESGDETKSKPRKRRKNG